MLDWLYTSSEFGWLKARVVITLENYSFNHYMGCLARNQFILLQKPNKDLVHYKRPNKKAL